MRGVRSLELAACLTAPVLPGERCVVLGWALGGEGSKCLAAWAILGEAGTARAVARSTWIAPVRDRGAPFAAR